LCLNLCLELNNKPYQPTGMTRDVLNGSLNAVTTITVVTGTREEVVPLWRVELVFRELF